MPSLAGRHFYYPYKKVMMPKAKPPNPERLGGYYIISYFQKGNNVRYFKACTARETAVYYGVNEHFENKRNDKVALLARG